jgi:hypothetical protein
MVSSLQTRSAFGRPGVAFCGNGSHVTSIFEVSRANLAPSIILLERTGANVSTDRGECRLPLFR